MTSQPGALEFFSILDGLVQTSQLVIDRPRGRAHPRIPEAIHPLDYGYLDGTRSGDDEGLDVFVGTATGSDIAGIPVIVDPVEGDAESKVLLDCSPEEVTAAYRFVRDVLGIGGLVVRRE